MGTFYETASLVYSILRVAPHPFDLLGYAEASAYFTFPQSIRMWPGPRRGSTYATAMRESMTLHGISARGFLPLDNLDSDRNPAY